MRIRKRRFAVILGVASVAALTVGGFALAHDANVSSLPTWKVTPAALPGPSPVPTSRVPVQLDVQTHTNYAHPGVKSQGGFAKTVTLLFDDDLKVNLAGIPSCTTTFPSSAELKDAWNTCGPGAPAANNAFLSPPTAVSGTASTAPPSNFSACTMVFKKSASSILLFAEVNTVGTFSCANPGTNTSGETSVVLTGTLGTAGVADFGTKLTVPNIDKLALPLDDFKAKVKRASVFTGWCKDTNKLLNLRGTFVYSNDPPPPPSDPQSTDVVNKTFTCS